MRRRTWLLVAAMVLLPAAIGWLIFFGAPLGMLGLERVQHHRSGVTVGVGGLLPHNYARIVSSPLYRRLLGETFKLAGLCALGSLLVGYPIAWVLRLAADWARRSKAAGSLGPVLVNVVMRSLGWLVVIGEFGLLQLVLQTLRMEADLSRRSRLMTELDELANMLEVFFPFMVLALYGAVSKIDLAVIRAARNLGATRTRAFLEVVLPLSLPGAAIGVVTVFALATGAYITVAAFGGGRVRAMAEMAYEESNSLLNWQLGAAVLVIGLVSAAILLRLLFAGLRRADRDATAGRTR